MLKSFSLVDDCEIQPARTQNVKGKESGSPDVKQGQSSNACASEIWL
jgi:hypothetical protein